MFKRTLTLCILALSCLLFSCSKNDKPAGPVIVDPEIPGNQSAKVTTRIQGVISSPGFLNEDVPIQGITVTCGDKTAVTDEFGTFHFDNIEVDSNAAVVKVPAAGNANPAARTLIIRDKSKIQFVEIRLAYGYHDYDKTFDATAGGEVAILYGPTLTLSPNQMLKADNTPYTGTATANCGNDYSAEVPMYAAARGISKANKQVALKKVNVQYFGFKGAAGETLHVDTTNNKSISYSCYANSDDPATVTTWYFNEKTGIWAEEGIATKAGNIYTFTTQHPGIIALATPFESVELKGEFRDTAVGMPWANKRVVVTLADQSTLYAVTNGEGQFAVKVPASQSLTVGITNLNCSDYITVTPVPVSTSSNDVNLGTIHAPVPDGGYLKISGAITDCDRAILKDGMVTVIGDSLHYEFPVKNGKYNAVIEYCSRPLYARMYATTKDNRTSPSVTLTLDEGYFYTKDLNTCGLQPGGYMSFTFKGQSYLYTYPEDSLDVEFGGSLSGSQRPYSGSQVYMQLTSTIPTTTGSYQSTCYYTPANSDEDWIGNIPYTITKFAAVGEYLEGTFTGVLTKDLSTDTATIRGEYRIFRSEDESLRVRKPKR
jgi:hypothetical protein